MKESVRPLFMFLAGLCVALVAASPALAGGKKPEHVVVVGIDGLRGDSVEQAPTPNMHKLMGQGASTLKAKAVFPTVSSPNWASIIMGAMPNTHRIFSNDWQPGQTPPFPTIFDAIHAKDKKAHIAVAYEWGGFGRLFNHEAVDFDASSLLTVAKPEPNVTPAQAVTRAAADIIKKDKPVLTFVHLDLVDHAGHASGYGTPEYLAVVGEADRWLGEILQAITDADIADETVTIVLADHGGKEKNHGGPSPEETLVPWIVAGPGIAAGKTLEEPVSVAQTAPTIARILHVKCPKTWTAKPVTEAFGKR